ncbi:MAG: hypothetical protein ACP5E5_11750 [Acidobacteriaceae bacterium]
MNKVKQRAWAADVVKVDTLETLQTSQDQAQELDARMLSMPGQLLHQRNAFRGRLEDPGRSSASQGQPAPGVLVASAASGTASRRSSTEQNCQQEPIRKQHPELTLGELLYNVLIDERIGEGRWKDIGEGRWKDEPA